MHYLISPILAVVAFFGMHPVQLAAPAPTSDPLVAIPGFSQVAFAPGDLCTAELKSWGGLVTWNGCPTDSCGDPITNPCQHGMVPNTNLHRCECYDGQTQPLCEARCTEGASGEITGWFCVKKRCQQASCTRNDAPVPLPGGGPVEFNPCTC